MPRFTSVLVFLLVTALVSDGALAATELRTSASAADIAQRIRLLHAEDDAPGRYLIVAGGVERRTDGSDLSIHHCARCDYAGTGVGVRDGLVLVSGSPAEKPSTLVDPADRERINPLD